MKRDHLHIGYILVFVLVLSLYAGCSTSQTTATQSNFRFGTQALDMEWKSNNQNRVFIGDDLILLLQLNNRGTADITNGQLYLSGYDPSYLNLQIEPSPSFTMPGKSQFDPNGDFSDLYTLRATNVKGPQNVNQFQQSILVAACYDYETTAVASVCIDSDPYNKITRQKACTMTTVSVGGQGAPVVVSSVEPVVGQNSVRFNIRLANSGGGVVFDPRISLDVCGQGLSFENTDRVVVSKVTLGGKSLDCTPQNPIWLNSGSASFTCECQGDGCIDPNVPAYQTLLEVDLRYGYRNSLATQVTVMNNN